MFLIIYHVVVNKAYQFMFRVCLSRV